MKHLYVLLFLLLAGCANVDKAEGYANDYVTTMYPTASNAIVSCEIGDSDGNGRVRCTISVTSADGATHVDDVECPSGWLPQPLKSQCVGVRGR